MPTYSYAFFTARSLVDEIHTEEVQQQASKHIVSKCPLVRNALEVGLVLRVGLNAQGCCKDELADTSAETGQESVERLTTYYQYSSMLVTLSSAQKIQDETYEVADENHVEELQGTNYD